MTLVRHRAARAAFTALLVSVAAAAIYRFVAPHAAPRLAHRALERIASTAGWTGRSQRVHFEPFALAFDFENMQVLDLDGDVMAAARLVRVDFSLRSLFAAHPVLDRLEIRSASARGTPRAAAAVWPLLERLATRARITTLEADVALTPADGHETSASLALRGTSLALGVGLGTLMVTASNVLGDGSRLDAALTAEPAEAGAQLGGTASLTRGQLALANWRLDAPNAALSVDATLSSDGLQASFTLLDGVIAAIDQGDARLDVSGGSAIASWEAATGLNQLQASASLADGARAELELSRTANGTFQLNARLDSIRAMELAAYIARSLGAAPASGAIGVEVSTGVLDATSFARLTAHHLRLDADAPTANMAIALLEDPGGNISLEIPLASDRPAAEQIVEQVSERVTAVGMMPFAALAALVGRDVAEIAAIEFGPGAAEWTPRGQEAIAALAAALRLRTRVGVRVEPNERSELDRAALASTQVALHVTLATAQTEIARGAVPLDLGSPRTQDVLDEFGRERLGAEALEEIGSSVSFDAAAPPTAPERAAYYRALFAALVAREPIADSALRRLASFRARAVERQLTDFGVAPSRFVDRGAPLPNDAVLAAVPLALEPAAVPRP